MYLGGASRSVSRLAYSTAVQAALICVLSELIRQGERLLLMRFRFLKRMIGVSFGDLRMCVPVDEACKAYREQFN